MNKQLVLFIGIVRRGEFESLKQRGLAVGVIIDTNWALKLPDFKQLDVVHYCDLNGPEDALLRVVDQLQKEWQITTVLVTHEFYVLPGAAVMEYLRLPGIKREIALLCNDKGLMHERFQQAIGHASTARFRRIEAHQDLIEFTQEHGFPIVLKPSNLAGSLFITFNTSLEEAIYNYDEMVERIPHFFSNAGWHDEQVHIQAEEFLQGTTHSVDLIIDGAGDVLSTPIVDELTGRECGWNDFHIFARYLPTQLSPQQQEEANRLAVAGVEALGIRSSIAHVELIQTVQGPKLLEIGVRFGGYRPELFERSFHFDLVYPYYQVRAGHKPSDTSREQARAVAVVTPGTREQGKLERVNYLERIQQLKTYVSHEVKAEIGQIVGPSTRGFYAPLGIVLSSDRAEDMYQDIAEIESWSDIFVVRNS